MLKGCWPSVRPSYQNASADSILRRWALVYSPTICVVSIFVALTWLGLSINNQTFRGKDLVVVITYFAALLIFECILLVHIAIRHQRATKLSQEPSCAESPPQAVAAVTTNYGGSPTLAMAAIENMEYVQNLPRPSVPRASLAKVVAEHPQKPGSRSDNAMPPTISARRPSPHQPQNFPALCEPYHPNARPEITRPPTAAAYMPQPPSLPVPQSTADLRSSWDLAMASNRQSTAAQAPASTPPPTELDKAEAHVALFVEPHSAPGRPIVQDERHATLRIPETSHGSAFPRNVPPRQSTQKMSRASLDERAHQPPQLQLQSPGSNQVRPHSHRHSSLLEKNLIALARA